MIWYLKSTGTNKESTSSLSLSVPTYVTVGIPVLAGLWEPTATLSKSSRELLLKGDDISVAAPPMLPGGGGEMHTHLPCGPNLKGVS